MLENGLTAIVCASGNPCFPKNWFYTFSGRKLTFSAVKLISSLGQVFVYLVIIALVLMLVISGIGYVYYGENPEYIKKWKTVESRQLESPIKRQGL